MDDKVFDVVKEVDLKQTMEKSYIDYAMSVIASRALPDVRDGLKPVQRRVLYSMIELNNGPDKPHRKCARIVGDTMGKYHPHGDSSIYGALVNMAQEWSTRYPLVDGHGNFGSVDGDSPAAMRYTEARLSKISMQMLADINKNTVDLIPNFDETEQEPKVLPSRFPNLLANGTNGIAVGMATNIPPHNLRELIDGVVKIIDNLVEEDRETEIDEILPIIKGPDFPTGAEILGRRGIESAYRTGRGKIKVRAISEIEPMDNGKTRIVISELPYMVNKARLIEKIADLVKLKKIDGITALRDESNKQGMRIVIELRRDVNANIILKTLYKHTQLQDSFGVIMLALVDNEPKVLNLLEMLKYYILHQEDVITRRCQFELDKAKKRAHILEGLLKALDFIDEVIKIIRGSNTTQEARENLMNRFELSEEQANAIVEMRLRQLTGLERAKLEDEFGSLTKQIERLEEILGNKKELLGVVKTEILEIREKYGDDRRTRFGYDDDDITEEELIPDEETIVTMTNLGYIKRMGVDSIKTQKRGGIGIKGMQTIEDDYLKELFMTNTHSNLLFFTNRGAVHKLKCYEIPEANRYARGIALINLIQLEPDEKISAVIDIADFSKNRSLILCTKMGKIKKTNLSEFDNIRKNGKIGTRLREGDELIAVKMIEEEQDIFLVTKRGKTIRMKDTDMREISRQSIGVIGINLNGDDEVVAMQTSTQGDQLLFVTEKGKGKRTDMNEFHTQKRGGMGVIGIKLNESTGNVVGCLAVRDDDEIILITNEGIMIRTNVNEINVIKRDTSGVRIMKLDEEKNNFVTSVARVLEKKEDFTENQSEE